MGISAKHHQQHSSGNNTSNSNGLKSQPAPTTPRHNSFPQRGAAPLPPSVPINLSLSEDERSPNRSNSDCTSPQFAKAMIASQTQAQTAEDDEEELYEYFPLSLDDWYVSLGLPPCVKIQTKKTRSRGEKLTFKSRMPPVDAIYRPHVVHHTIVPPDLKAQQVRSRTKRYFSSD